VGAGEEERMGRGGGKGGGRYISGNSIPLYDLEAHPNITFISDRDSCNHEHGFSDIMTPQ
jgi:hypothetical protein